MDVIYDHMARKDLEPFESSAVELEDDWTGRGATGTDVNFLCAHRSRHTDDVPGSCVVDLPQLGR